MKYVDKEIHEIRYFERAITLPFLFQRQAAEEPNNPITMTKFDEIFDVPSKIKTKQELPNTNTLLQEVVCCSRSVEQQCSNTFFATNPTVRRKPKDPYDILDSLTSQQIRRLISTSYNSCFKTNKLERVETASKKSQISTTKSNKKNRKHQKNLSASSVAMDALVRRLTQPTQASLMKKRQEVSVSKNAAEVCDWFCDVVCHGNFIVFQVGLVRRGNVYVRVFPCERCKVRNEQGCSLCHMQE